MTRTEKIAAKISKVKVIDHNKLEELRDRMKKHSVGNHPLTGEPDTAIVVLTARELDELLDYISSLED
jgi:hypothetical protein